MIDTALDLAVTVEIGGIPLRFHTHDAAFAGVMTRRFAGFVRSAERPAMEFDIDLFQPRGVDPDDDVVVSGGGDRWRIARSDFAADVNLASRRGRIRQIAHPYATDTLIRIVHTLLLARTRGCLLHASSGIRNGRAFVFFGPSGAGKSTIAGLAPADVTLLTDEVSYLRNAGGAYVAHGTPFTGELGRMGDNVSAPVAGLYRLIQGDSNRIEPMSQAEAVSALLESVLFFTNDRELVHEVFDAACEMVARVPVWRLVFRREASVWELLS